jgi:hypothetical protein
MWDSIPRLSELTFGEYELGYNVTYDYILLQSNRIWIVLDEIKH